MRVYIRRVNTKLVLGLGRKGQFWVQDAYWRCWGVQVGGVFGTSRIGHPFPRQHRMSVDTLLSQSAYNRSCPPCHDSYQKVLLIARRPRLREPRTPARHSGGGHAGDRRQASRGRMASREPIMVLRIRDVSGGAVARPRVAAGPEAPWNMGALAASTVRGRVVKVIRRPGSVWHALCWCAKGCRCNSPRGMVRRLALATVYRPLPHLLMSQELSHAGVRVGARRELLLLSPRRGPLMTMRARMALAAMRGGRHRSRQRPRCVRDKERRDGCCAGFCGSGAPSCIPLPFQNDWREHNAARSRGERRRRP
jgi:hypothetical protein